MKTSRTFGADRRNDERNPKSRSCNFRSPPTASRIPTHKAFSCACCAAVRWTTFLGLQFQMDCVGSVSFLS